MWDKALVKSLESRSLLRRMHWVYFKMVTFPLSLTKTWSDSFWLFTVITWWDLPWWDKNLWKCGGLLRLWPQRVLTHRLIFAQPLAICQNYHFSALKFMAPVALAPGKLNLFVFFCICVSLQTQGGNWPWDLGSLMSPRKVVDFLFVQLFLYLWEW